jgi:hypothetical protein
MLAVAARIPDAAQRDQFADRLSHKARITEEVVRAEIRKAAVQRQTNVDEIERRAPNLGQVKVAERGLIWGLMKDPQGALGALLELENADLDGLATAGILRQARSLQGWPAAGIPGGLLERLSTGETALVREIASQSAAPSGDVADCARTLKRLRYDRERAALQREIDRLQEDGPERHDAEIVALWERKKELLQRIEHS